MGSSYNSNFIGNTVIRLESIDSTNQYLDEFLSKNSPVEGLVVIADYQSQGQGQNGRIWESKPGDNLLMSLYLKPDFLPAAEGFYLNVIASLAIVQVLEEVYNDQRVRVKWPNDVYVGNNKISGILIKNTISGQNLSDSIIGIGLNVNQEDYGELQATSMRLLLDKKQDRKHVMERLFYHLQENYQELKNGNKELLRKTYELRMYRRGENHKYELESGDHVMGSIQGIKEDGRLAIMIDGQPRYFYNNTITYL